jgi:phenylacetate-coenzyme A ligase PaaK-like adenylate-forming protein
MKLNLVWIFARRLRAINFYMKNPISTQENVFNYLIKKGKKTQWGIKHNYHKIKSIRDYQALVPISTYEDLEPYIKRILAGDNNLFWPTKIKYFAKSSGTTSSKSKYIPVSSEALKDCHYRGGKEIFAKYLEQNRQAQIFKGQSFALGGSRQNLDLGNKKYIADVSVILMKNLPIWAQLKRSPKLSIASLQEWEEKLEKIAKVISRQNITSISGVPSWNLILAKKVLALTGKSNLLEVWPNLELFMHGGVSFTPYRQQFEAIIPGKKMNYLEVYNASEGFFAFQDDLARKDMLLALDCGVFYEFLPLSELGEKDAKALTLEEVELNKNYALIISTNSGLWRYLIGDTVKITSRYPFRIIISGRTKSFINAFGEELIVENSDRALNQACKICQAVVRDYTAAPVYMSDKQQGRHQWLIEFEKKPKSLGRFTVILDNELKKLNSDYEAKRYKNLALADPEIIIAKDHLFYSFLKQKNRLGGQNKVLRLSNNRNYIEELLALNMK